MQTVLEFMDKGMKGLLSGDMTVALLVDISRSISKYQQKFDALSKQINDLVLKQETMDKFLNKHFNLEGDVGKELNDQNMPQYVHTLNNFQDFMVTMDRKDWQKSLQIKESRYMSESTKKKGRKQLTVDAQVNPAKFDSVENMLMFMQ